MVPIIAGYSITYSRPAKESISFFMIFCNFLLFDSTGRNSCQDVFLEEQIDHDRRQHNDDDSCRQILPGPLLRVGIIHQERGQRPQLVLRHIEVWNVHVVDDGNRLDDHDRGRGRSQQREDNSRKQAEIGTAIQQRALI